MRFAASISARREIWISVSFGDTGKSEGPDLEKEGCGRLWVLRKVSTAWALAAMVEARERRVGSWAGELVPFWCIPFWFVIFEKFS